MPLETTSPGPLADTMWRVMAYRDRNQQVATVLSGTEVTAHFFPDGRLAGKAGCNNYRANYAEDAHHIQVGPVATTRMLCPMPQGIMQQEAAYVAALATAATFTIDGDELKLLAVGGELVVKYERATP